MTLAATGAISIGGSVANLSINVELGLAATATSSLNDAALRTLAGVPSGAISMNNFYGKSNRVVINLTIAANTANYTATLTSQGGYVSGKTDFILTINSGIYVYSTTTSPALQLSAINAGDTVTIVNNGYIMGLGGNGEGNAGVSGQPYTASPATSGSPAITLGSNTTINNTNAAAYIGGGGGGGGGSNGATLNASGGGGAGGGDGGPVHSTSKITGGGVGAVGSSAGGGVNGAGGGRVFPGTGGAGGIGATGATGGGAGGGGGSLALIKTTTQGGGGGGGWGASGGNWNNWSSSTTTATGGAGGAANAAGGDATNSTGTLQAGSPRAGAAGGKAVNLNGFVVTWTSGNTTRVYGSIA